MTDAVMALLVMKVSALLVAALLAARVLRRAPAARRHGVWSAAFLALLALPPLALVLPALRVPVPTWSAPNAAPMLPTTSAVGTTAGHPGERLPAVATEPSAQSGRADGGTPPIVAPSLGALLIGIWLAGAAGALIALLIAFARVARVAATARELDAPDWREACRRIAARLGYRRTVRVLASSAVTTPMAGGVVRPTVFVPADAASWDAERREIVIAHEIAHLASGDLLRKLLSRLACTMYWFHPLMWLAQRHASSDCEQACDEAVLALGIRPSSYARVLLDFADAAPLRVAGAVVPIVRRARLEERLVAILRSSPRPAAGRRGVLPAAVAAALTMSLAAAQPSAPAVTAPARRGAAAADAAAPIATIASAPPAASEATAPPRTVASPRTVVTSRQQPAAAECWSRGGDGRSFSGTISMSGTTIHEQIGRRGNERVMQTQFGNLRACMVTEGFDGERDDRPSDWPARSARVVLETQGPNDVRRMEIAGGRITWTVTGESRGIDAAAQEWRSALLAVLDLTWDLSQLRGQASTLRGEISTIRGERSTLLGEISTLRGQVSSLRGEISSLRGNESQLRGEISSIRGHESTLRGRISTERGAISTLQASRWDSGLDRDEIAARIRRHEDEIRRIETEIDRYDANARVREVERQLVTFDVEGKVAAVERQIRDFDLDGKIAAVEREIAALDVERRVAALEREIEALDVPGRSRDIEQRREAALTRLRTALGSR